MNYDLHANKIIGIVSNKIEPHIALNVVGHLGIALGSALDENDVMGRTTHIDASGISHPGISRYSLVVKTARPAKLHEAIVKARNADGIFVFDYPKAMLETGHDDDLAAAIESSSEEQLDYLGALLFGPTPVLDEICGRYMLWSM